MVSVHPSLIYESMHKVKEGFEKLYEVKLPDPTEWYCFRLDTCENFVLDSEEQVRNYISYLQRLNYPRRVKNMYEDTGLFFASRHNTLKVYAKGAEFKKHDMQRIADEKRAKYLYEQAKKILRIEVEHKRRIRYLIEQYEKENNVALKKFQGYVRMKDFIDVFDFEEEMKNVVSKILCGTETKIMETEGVLKLLRQKYSDRQARSFRQMGISLMVLDNKETGCFLDKGVPEDFSLDMSEENKYYQLPVSELIYPTDDTEEPF